jgi:hypothetical protein
MTKKWLRFGHWINGGNPTIVDQTTKNISKWQPKTIWMASKCFSNGDQIFSIVGSMVEINSHQLDNWNFMGGDWKFSKHKLKFLFKQWPIFFKCLTWWSNDQKNLIAKTCPKKTSLPKRNVNVWLEEWNWYIWMDVNWQPMQNGHIMSFLITL